VAPFGIGSKEKGDTGSKKASGDARREAVALVVAYVKQETLDPLKQMLRFVLFGVVGSVAIAIGTVLLLVAALRVLQTETGAFHGNLSWLPYLVVVVLALAVIALSAWRITAGPAARRIPPKKTSD
jgi:predicted cobalt transporter CbtA